jgi:hypothetical protein
MIAVLWREPFPFVLAAALPPPVLVAIAHHGKMAVRPESMHEHRQTMFLIFGQGGI